MKTRMPNGSKVRSKRSLAVRLGVALAAVSGLAMGQAAQGQYALDRNQQIGSGGINPARPNFADEVRFRNAIVTGNAPGGFSFRGDVGYRAPGEFQGRLGSDSTFSFRRDSYYSGLGGLGIRGTEALQYQFAMTTGNAPPQGLAISPEFWRAGARATAAAVSGTGPGSGSGDRFGYYGSRGALTGAGEDQGLSLLSMRSPSSFAANRGLQPVTLNIGEGSDGTTRTLTASVLRGLSFDTISSTPGAPGDQADTWGRPKPVEKPGQESNLRMPDPGLDTSVKSGAVLTEADRSVKTRSPYDEVLKRFQTAAEEPSARPMGVPFTPGEAAQTKPAVPDWQQRLDELRNQLADPMARPPGGPAAPGDASGRMPGEKPGEKPGGKPGDQTKPGEGQSGGQPGLDADDINKRVTGLRPETIELIRRAGGQVNMLAQPAFDAYGTHMAAGQQHLATGRYFDAEERFAAALGARPRDPMAAVGRVHSMIGSGMVMSGAINLRSLLAEHPELIAVKYSPELLPSKERSVRLVAQLGELAAVPGRGRDAALLLAYLNYQLGDIKGVSAALDQMVKPAASGGPEVDGETAQLAGLLRAVWTRPPDEAKPAGGAKPGGEAKPAGGAAPKGDAGGDSK